MHSSITVICQYGQFLLLGYLLFIQTHTFPKLWRQPFFSTRNMLVLSSAWKETMHMHRTSLVLVPYWYLGTPSYRSLEESKMIAYLNLIRANVNSRLYNFWFDAHSTNPNTHSSHGAESSVFICLTCVILVQTALWLVKDFFLQVKPERVEWNISEVFFPPPMWPQSWTSDPLILGVVWYILLLF